MEIKNSPSVDFDTLLEEMNKDIFNQEMADIVEVTYAYADLWNWVFLNKTLFWTFLWKTYGGKDKQEEKRFWEELSINIAEIFTQTKSKLLHKKSLVINYKELLQPLLKENNPRIQILLWSLDYVSNILDLTLAWLPFEAQKAWISYNFSGEEIEKRVNHLEEIETKLFGWNVSENEYEVQWSYNNLSDLFQTKKEKLTSEEHKRFSEYLQTLKQIFPYIIDTKESLEKVAQKNEKSEILNQEISRENYVKILKLALEIYGIEKPVIIEERSSIYDGEDYLGIPESEAYKTLKIQRILELIQHEIETHYIIEKNNTQTLGKFRWAKNLQREEWLAMTAEAFLQWKNLEDVDVSWAIPDLLMWEILWWEEYKDFHILLSKLKGAKNASALFLRRKRNYPLHYKWVQHKDTSYNRGQHKIVDFIKWWWSVKDLYLWKVSFEDLEKTKEIMQKENIKLMYPLLIWELLQYVVLWNKLHENEFWIFIEKKYPFLNMREEIANNSIEKLSFWVKRKVIQILQLIK